MQAPDSIARGAPGRSQVVEFREQGKVYQRGQSLIESTMCTTVPHWCAPFAPGDPTVPICTLHLQTISCVDLRGMRRGQHASVSGRRALTARYLSRYARRARTLQFSRISLV